MTTTRKKRPRDPMQLGKLIVDIATGQTPDAEDDGKNAAAAELGREGGAARAASLTAEERSAHRPKARPSARLTHRICIKILDFGVPV